MNFKRSQQAAYTQLKTIMLVLAVFSLILLSFFTVYMPQKAQALGDIQSVFSSQACTNCATAFPNNVAQGDFIIVEISDTAQANLPTGVTDSLGNSYSLAVSDNTQLGVAIYIANQTHATGTVTVTVAFSGGQQDVFTDLAEVNEITSSTPTASNHDAALSGGNPIDASTLIPGKDNYCAGIADANTGGGGSPNPLPTNPMGVNGLSTTALAGIYLSIGLLGSYPISTGNTFQIAILKALSATNSGNALVSLGKWDYAVACFSGAVSATTTHTNTATSTILTTATGTIFPEPSNSIDISLIVIAIIIYCIMIFAGMKINQRWAALFCMIGALTLTFLEIGMLNNPTIILGQNQFPEPQWMTIVIGLFVLVGFSLFIVKLRRG